MLKKIIQWIILALVIALAAAGIVITTINSQIVKDERSSVAVSISPTHKTLTKKDIAALKKANPQCVMVLGAGIVDRETPTPMLKDRLDTAVMLYRAGAAKKVLLTGDNGTVTHNEIHVMLHYMLKKGIPSADIFCDHAGFSTYESMYRADSIFEVSRMVVVTQTYHMYRALYIARHLGLKAVGVGADQKKYSGQAGRELREVLARNKDFFKVRSKASAVGGEKIPITGSGVSSHGE